MAVSTKPKKRTWVYVCNPQVYGMSCIQCGGVNITWSEFEHMIWCFHCKIDTLGTPGVFAGPIGINTARLMGMSFDRVNLKTGEITKFRARRGEMKVNSNKIQIRGVRVEYNKGHGRFYIEFPLCSPVAWEGLSRRDLHGLHVAIGRLLDKTKRAE